MDLLSFLSLSTYCCAQDFKHYCFESVYFFLHLDGAPLRFVYLVALGLHCSARVFFHRGEQRGAPLVAVHGLLIAVASLVVWAQ